MCRLPVDGVGGANNALPTRTGGIRVNPSSTGHSGPNGGHGACADMHCPATIFLTAEAT
ncbi:hypothetical protein [Kibdelosporangium philippinense]|uniref:hypothetical protein n=1 Tax=Kibdelosporangium philippinense TaxID=211113 RepID=UPI003607AC31